MSRERLSFRIHSGRGANLSFVPIDEVFDDRSGCVAQHPSLFRRIWLRLAAEVFRPDQIAKNDTGGLSPDETQFPFRENTTGISYSDGKKRDAELQRKIEGTAFERQQSTTIRALALRVDDDNLASFQ